MQSLQTPELQDEHTRTSEAHVHVLQTATHGAGFTDATGWSEEDTVVCRASESVARARPGKWCGATDVALNSGCWAVTPLLWVHTRMVARSLLKRPARRLVTRGSLRGRSLRGIIFWEAWPRPTDACSARRWSSDLRPSRWAEFQRSPMRISKRVEDHLGSGYLLRGDAQSSGVLRHARLRRR